MKINFWKLSYGSDKEITEIFGDEKMFNKKDWDFINDTDSKGFRLYENSATFYVYKNAAMLQHYKNLLAEATTLLEQIELNIKK